MPDGFYGRGDVSIFIYNAFAKLYIIYMNWESAVARKSVAKQEVFICQAILWRAC